MTECVTDSSQDTSISSQYHLLSQRYKQSVPLKTQHQHEKKVCTICWKEYYIFITDLIVVGPGSCVV